MQEVSITKLEQLKNNLRKMKSVVIAFSGGVDSTFLVNVAHDVLGENAIAVTATSSTYPQRELEQAKKFAKHIGIKHIIINSEETEIDDFSKNPNNRCYYCKKELFSKIKQITTEEHFNYALDGSNVDDKTDYRPGMKALKELGVVSPLKEVGLRKQEIKELSRTMNLGTWNKPAFACLASRFPYGVEITKSRLAQVEKAESFLYSLGIKQFRVRYHTEIAKIEVTKNDFQLIITHSDEIVKKFKELGFKYITLDIEGYRTGSLNEVLNDGKNIKGF
jgi:uncharacterized protein